MEYNLKLGDIVTIHPDYYKKNMLISPITKMVVEEIKKHTDDCTIVTTVFLDNGDLYRAYRRIETLQKIQFYWQSED